MDNNTSGDLPLKFDCSYIANHKNPRRHSFSWGRVTFWENDRPTNSQDEFWICRFDLEGKVQMVPVSIELRCF